MPVLVVDDDFDIRQVLAEVLGDSGYSVVAARHGAEALEVLKTVTPRLILLDLSIPTMDGVEFRKRQLRDPVIASNPTVAISAVNDMRERIQDLRISPRRAAPRLPPTWDDVPHPRAQRGGEHANVHRHLRVEQAPCKTTPTQVEAGRTRGLLHRVIDPAADFDGSPE
jgi:CheY-like chemotaxis protein